MVFLFIKQHHHSLSFSNFNFLPHGLHLSKISS
jgi:hypothetical protein